MPADTVSDNSGTASQFGNNYGMLPGDAPPPLIAPDAAEKPVTKGTAGTATTLGASTQDSIERNERNGEVSPNSSAYIDPANPKPPAPNIALSATDAAATATSTKNVYLGSIYAVALTVLMGAMLKLDMYHERVDSQQWLGLQKEMYESTMATAKYILAAGKAEMMACFAKAVCCAVGAALSVTGAVGAAWKGPRTSIGATIQQGTQALNAVGGQDSIASNLAQGVGAYLKAKYDALQKIQEYYTGLAKQMEERIESDRRDTADTKSQMLQAYQQWMNTLSQLTQRG